MFVNAYFLVMAMQLNHKVLVVTFAIAYINVGTSYESEVNPSSTNLTDLKNQLSYDFPKTNIILDDGKSLLKDKCIEYAGPENGTRAFQEIESSPTSLTECINSVVNYTAIQEEISEASPKGELDVVFNKYCLKRPEVVQCVETFSSKMSPCFDKDELQNQDVLMRIVKSLLSFICHKGGDQIALFIAERGPECLESRKEKIQNCVNSTFSGYVPTDGKLKTLPKFVMGMEQCDDIDRLQTCVVMELETCKEITPANIIESMFRFVKTEISSVCSKSDSKTNKQIANSSYNTRKNSVFFVFTIILALRT